MNSIIITFEDGTKKEYRKGISLGDVIDDIKPEKEIICGCFNGVVVNYNSVFSNNGKLSLYGLDSSI